MASKKNGMLSVLFMVFILAAPLFSQNDTYVNKNNSTGVESFRPYSGLRENINLQNDNINIVIPLFHLKGRNGLDLPVLARYNSKLREWVFYPDEVGGGFYVYELIEGLSDPDDEYFNVRLLPDWSYIGGACGVETSVENVWVFTEVDGTRRELLNRDYLDEVVPCSVDFSNQILDSVDSSHLQLRESPSGQTVYLKDGTRLLRSSPQFNTLIQDTNGNQITSSFDSATNTLTVTDSLGRVVEKKVNSPNNLDVMLKDSSGVVQQTYRVTPTELIFPDAGGAPNGLRYRFEWQLFGPIYDPNGFGSTEYERELIRITSPTNGYTRYAWQLRSSSLGPTQLTGKYVNADDGQGEAFWQYSMPTSAEAQETAPDGTYTKHFFDGYGRETETQFFSATGTLRKKILRSWPLDQLNPRILAETSILEPNTTNLHSKVELSYDTNGYLGRTNGNVTELREYSFGTGAPGGLVRRTASSYLVNSTYGVSGLHVLERKTQEIIYDSAGAQKARTDFTYDDYTFPRTLLDTPGAVQRDAGFGTSYTTRGNLSRIARWLNTTGGFLNTDFRYDICGNIREETDPRGYITKTHFNDAYQYAYPYQLEDAKGFTSNRDYDFSNASKYGFGHLTREVDINGNTTTYTYDRLGRNKTINYPDGGLVEGFYSDFDLLATHRGAPIFQNQASSLPLRRKAYSKIQDSPYLEIVELTVFDGFERDFMRSTSNNSQMDWTRTEYDGKARLKRLSNPKSLVNTTEIPASTEFTKWTTYEYDVLDRITRVTTQDGQSVTTVYDANVATVTDQVGNRRKSEYDALGRLTVARETNPSNAGLRKKFSLTTPPWKRSITTTVSSRTLGL